MGRFMGQIGLAATVAIVAFAASAPARAEQRTACTALDICYCVNTQFLNVINFNVLRLHQLIADKWAKGMAAGYLSVPLSPVGGGSFQINSEAAKFIAAEVETRFGQSSVWILNPAAEDPAAHGNDAVMGAGGADFMYMWTRVLEGSGGHGEDFDFFYFDGPTDCSKYFLQPPKDSNDQQKFDRNKIDDYRCKLNDFFDRRVASDPDFEQAVEQGGQPVNPGNLDAGSNREIFQHKTRLTHG